METPLNAYVKGQGSQPFNYYSIHTKKTEMEREYLDIEKNPFGKDIQILKVENKYFSTDINNWINNLFESRFEESISLSSLSEHTEIPYSTVHNWLNNLHTVDEGEKKEEILINERLRDRLQNYYRINRKNSSKEDKEDKENKEDKEVLSIENFKKIIEDMEFNLLQLSEYISIMHNLENYKKALKILESLK